MGMKPRCVQHMLAHMYYPVDTQCSLDLFPNLANPFVAHQCSLYLHNGTWVLACKIAIWSNSFVAHQCTICLCNSTLVLACKIAILGGSSVFCFRGAKFCQNVKVFLGLESLRLFLENVEKLHLKTRGFTLGLPNLEGLLLQPSNSGRTFF